MNIVAEYDPSTDNAPAGFFTAVNAAIAYIDNQFLDPVTIPIMFSYGTIEGSTLEAGALGESDTNGYIEPFSQVVSWLTASASSQADAASIKALPTSDPTNGQRFWVSDAEAQVFGDGSNPNFTDPEDGFVALSSTAPLTYDPTNRAVAGAYDAIGILEHEITEAIGRISDLGTRTYGGYRLWSPMDLFRYSGPGAHTVAYNSAAYFSADGQTMLLPFDNGSRNGGDSGDWATNVSGDSFEAFTSPGAAGVVTPTDLLLMDLLGFRLAAPTTYDFNGDQKSDFLIENSAGAVVVGEVGAAGQAAYTQVGALGPEWSFKGAGDFLGDGDTAYLLENTNGAVVVGDVANGQTSFTQVGGLGAEWKFAGVGDFLGHGLADFLIESTTGAVVVGEVSGGHAGYTQVGALGPEWRFVGVGDVMGDGQSDFLIESTSGAVVVAEVKSGVAQYTQVSVIGHEWSFVGMGDFLARGTDQFLIENTAGALVVGDVVDGNAVYTQIAALGPEWKFVGTGDYLGEGHDQFLIESSTGAVVVGDYTGGQIHYTQVGALGAEWLFH